ncbi:MAG TPA: hypothetical protein PLM21_01305 [Fervidobacterium sp.]|nr:hypothetical protein [Fervidobacterium sp.]HQI93401.1 hypothetical protein [Fervidobacterium sp.]
MEIKEIEEKLLSAVEKLESHIEQYDKDVAKINSQIEKLRSDFDDLWSTLHTAWIVLIVMFVAIAITWFFPFQAATYGYLSPDDIRRKTVFVSVEALIFGIALLFVLASTFYGRSKE